MLKASKMLPSWFRQQIPNGEEIAQMKTLLRQGNLHTVCESARCPNMGKCWGQGVATFMILGNVCTRACRFCAVKAGIPDKVNPLEPRQVALMVKQLNLRYVVITSVTRDDLADEGVGQFARVIEALKEMIPRIKIEVLIPDFSNRGELLQEIVKAQPDVIGHNMETVQRLSLEVRPQALYERSLAVLKNLKQEGRGVLIKTSFMVGMGESREEIMELMRDLKGVGCDMVTIGQYLAPDQLKRHVKVQRFVTPEEFEIYKREGMALGFKHVMSGPLVRSSFVAEQGYQEVMGG